MLAVKRDQKKLFLTFRRMNSSALSFPFKKQLNIMPVYVRHNIYDFSGLS